MFPPACQVRPHRGQAEEIHHTVCLHWERLLRNPRGPHSVGPWHLPRRSLVWDERKNKRKQYAKPCYWRKHPLNVISYVRWFYFWGKQRISPLFCFRRAMTALVTLGPALFARRARNRSQQCQWTQAVAPYLLWHSRRAAVARPDIKGATSSSRPVTVYIDLLVVRIRWSCFSEFCSHFSPRSLYC